MAGKIYEAIPAIMKELSPIAKGETNAQQHFKYRGIDTIYNELHWLLAKHGVFTVPEVIEDRTEERETKSGGNLIYRSLRIKYHFYADDGSFVTATVQGEGMDSGDKASNKAMAVGHKYALLQVFCIPTDEIKDPDADTPEISKPKELPFDMVAKSTFLNSVNTLAKKIPEDEYKKFKEKIFSTFEIRLETIDNRSDAELYYKRLNSFVAEFLEDFKE